MYVIATVICPNFHFSVSLHVPFLNLLFEQIANSNAYLLAKIGVDTAENEPLEVWGENSIQYSLHSFGKRRRTRAPRQERCPGRPKSRPAPRRTPEARARGRAQRGVP